MRVAYDDLNSSPSSLILERQNRMGLESKYSSSHGRIGESPQKAKI